MQRSFQSKTDLVDGENLSCDGTEEGRLPCATLSPNILFKVASQGHCAVKVVTLCQSREKRYNLCSQEGLGARRKLFQNQKETIWKCKRKWRSLEWIGFLCRGKGILSPLMVPELHLLYKKSRDRPVHQEGLSPPHDYCSIF